MFGKDKEKELEMVQPKLQKDINTVLAPGVEISGDISFSGALHVDCKVKGNILAAPGAKARVQVSDKGEVEGEIRAPEIIINGKVRGDVYSTEKLNLAARAAITGNVHYNMIEMEMGAEVNGSLMHDVQKDGRTAAPTPLSGKTVNPAQKPVAHHGAKATA